MGLCPSTTQTDMKLFLLSCLTALAVASYADYTKLQFAQFKEKYGKTYLSRSEHQLRYQVFQENIKKIEEHNRSGASWKMAVNQFSDLTQAEFQSMYMGGYKRLPTPAGNFTSMSKPAKDLPAEIDWRTKGAITDVKNQGQCGSCWAFATTEMIESYAAIATGSLPTLSTQQVTSCTPNPLKCGGTGGCYGSIPQLGYTYIQLFGHITEEDYPYISGNTMQTEDCMYMPEQAAGAITGYNILEPNSLEAVMDFIANQGPLAVAAYASPWGRYSSGVFDGCPYDGDIAINHAIVLVGYGTDPNEGDYWL